jgi:Rha family phage regulatory protein
VIDLPALPDPLLTVHDAQPVADSRIVAKTFGKRHADVLRTIRDLLRMHPDLERNFAFLIDAYEAGKGALRKSPYYLMNEDGFMLLVMGFTGEAAVLLKLRFIAAYTAMRDLLNMQRDALNERMRDWELRERESAQRGTVGGKALCVRKREKPALEGEHRSILQAVQLTLRLNQDPK